ncbi:MAG: CaiB/BaiF CoA transferase family protein [Qingshengfaniella sp.]
MQALKGITVLDFSHVVAGPLATHFLALNGARVIKVEPPRGDPLRNYTANRDELGMAPAFRGINLGKESVVLDLKTETGRQEALRLAAEADVLVENFRPGVLARLGLGPEALKAANPRLIRCSISGFGQSGPMAQVPAIDQIVQSLSGLMRLSGHEGDPAMRVGFPLVDTFTGLLSAFAIMTAITQQLRSPDPQGQEIDVAMLDATLVMLLSVVNPMLMTGEQPHRTGNRGFSRAPTADTFACQDGEITTGAVEEVHVNRMLKVLGLTHLLENPAYADRMARLKNADAMHVELARAFATQPAAYWEKHLQEAGVAAARVLEVRQAIALPHLQDRDLFLDVTGGPALNAGFRFARGGPGIAAPAPELGTGQTGPDE